MNPEDFDRAIIEVLQQKAASAQAAATSHSQPKEKMEFSKWVMVIATLIFVGTWIVAIISWFIWRDIPTELIIFINICYGMGSSAYMCKTAYENKLKIHNGFQGGSGK